jgi:hypothetical protein
VYAIHGSNQQRWALSWAQVNRKYVLNVPSPSFAIANSKIDKVVPGVIKMIDKCFAGQLYCMETALLSRDTKVHMGALQHKMMHLEAY